MRLIINYRMKKLASQINTPLELLPAIGVENHSGKPYIRIFFPAYYLIAFDNGINVYKKRFFNIDDLLYEVFEQVTFDMALQYELKNRILGQDFRRLAFEYQLELMRQLSSQWYNNLSMKIEAILEKYPYNDK